MQRETHYAYATTHAADAGRSFGTRCLPRDGGRCVICGAPGQDAHHIVERRLFDDGGYYLDNGATLCAACHVKAEMTVLSCDDIRTRFGRHRPGGAAATPVSRPGVR